MIETVPQLLSSCIGPYRCFYCGAPSDGSFAVSDYVKDSFNDRSIVACPGSKYVCCGCVLCLREGGSGMGRREFESEYYADFLNKVMASINVIGNT